jgi:dihydrolipoamide dehydrogenase
MKEVLLLEKFDVVVIGGGPGGYPAAIRASQLGANVAIIEADRLGGECTNYGCVPTKSLVFSATLIRRFNEIKKLDVEVFEEILNKAKKVAEEVSLGIKTLLKGYDVEIYKSLASFDKEGKVVLKSGDVLKAEKYIIATGTDPQPLKGVEFDGEVIHNNRTILNLKERPSSIVVIGGGYVGVEISYIMASLGVEVTLIEALDRLLYYLDKDLSRYALRILRRSGVKVILRSPVKKVEKINNEVVVDLGEKKVVAEKALIAVGRTPRIPQGLKYLNVETDARGYIKVDQTLRTSNPKVYAVGDISGPPLLAHKAMFQGEVAAENALGKKRVYDDILVPQVIFTEPEMASVGLTFEEALKRGLNAGEIKFYTGGLARSRIEGVTDGFVKIVYDRETKRVLGVHMAGPLVSELIGEATLIVKLRVKLDEISEILHPHPTASEVFREAALYALRRPIHYIIKI